MKRILIVLILLVILIALWFGVKSKNNEQYKITTDWKGGCAVEDSYSDNKDKLVFEEDSTQSTLDVLFLPEIQVRFDGGTITSSCGADLSALNQYLQDNGIEFYNKTKGIPDYQMFVVPETMNIKKAASFIASLPYVAKVFRNYPPSSLELRL